MLDARRRIGLWIRCQPNSIECGSLAGAGLRFWAKEFDDWRLMTGDWMNWVALFMKYAPSSDFPAPGRSFYLKNMIRLIPGGKDSKMKSKIPAKLLDPHPRGWNDLTKVNEQEMQLNARTLGSSRSTDTDTLSVICDAKRQRYGLSPVKACFGIAGSFEKLLWFKFMK